MIFHRQRCRPRAALIGCLILSTLNCCSSYSWADNKDRWQVEHSQPDDDGAFLNVPINYGQWVPLSQAKATILNVASHLQGRHQISAGSSSHQSRQPQDRGSRGPVSFVSTEEASREVLDPVVQGAAHVPVPQWGHRRPGSSRGARGPPQRRQDWITRHRQLRKLPRPHSVAPLPVPAPGAPVPPSPSASAGTSFVDTITSFFSSSSLSSSPSSSSPSKAHQRQHYRKHHQNLPSSSSPSDSQASESYNAGTVFNLPPPYRQNKQPSRPGSVPTRSRQPTPTFNVPTSQAKETLLTPNPVIRLVPAPDLSYDGPPLIEVGGAQHEQSQPETVVGGGQQHYNHLSGFVPVNFEPTTSGVSFTHHQSNQVAPHHSGQYGRDYSVVVAGFNESPDPESLAQYLKEGNVRGNKKAFISTTGKDLPDGFQKVDLPFMDKKTSPSELPSVFIAPVGFKVPDGYKGHPLPFDPKIVDARHPTRSQATKLVEDIALDGDVAAATTSTTTTSSSKKDSTFLIKDKIKLARKRPSLSGFYKSKARKEQEQQVKLKVSTQEDGSLRKPEKTTKRRVLKKIVRRPYKNTVRKTFRATPASFKIEQSQANPFLTERPRIIHDIVSSSTTVSTTTKSESSTTTATTVNNQQEISATAFAQNYEGVSSTESLQVSTTSASESSTVSKSGVEQEETTFRSLFEEASKEAESFVEVLVEEARDQEGEIKLPTAEGGQAAPTSGYEPTVRIAIPDHFEPTTQEEQQFLLVTTIAPVSEENKSEAKTPEASASNPSTTASSPVVVETTPATEAAAVDEAKFTALPYAPTPFRRRPVRRLDSYNRLRKQQKPKQVFGPTLPPVVISTSTSTSGAAAVSEPTEPAIQNRLKYRFGGSGGDGNTNHVNTASSSEGISTRLYGQRIRTRKRPTTAWNGEHGTGESLAKPTKTEEYKKKFRPFFDQLYSKLSGGNSKTTTRPRRRYFARRRSTTTPNPYTINAEIYEVHPHSGERVTGTTTSETPNETTGDSNDVDDVENIEELAWATERTADDAAGPYTSSSIEYEDEYLEAPEIPTEISQPADEPALEYQEHELEEEREQEEEHETADKHSTTVVPSPEEAQPTLAPFNLNTPYSYPEAPLNYDYVANDIIDRADDVDADDLTYLDSQRIETTWNNVDYYDSKLEPGIAEKSSPSPRLTQYEKDLSPSHEIIREHDAHYQKPANIVNEHSQQHFEATENGFVPVHVPVYQNGQALASKTPDYAEIRRNDDGSVVVVKETVDVASVTPDSVSLDESLVVDFSIPVEVTSSEVVVTPPAADNVDATTEGETETTTTSGPTSEVLDYQGEESQVSTEPTLEEETTQTWLVLEEESPLVEELASDFELLDEVEKIEFGASATGAPFVETEKTTEESTTLSATTAALSGDEGSSFEKTTLSPHLNLEDTTTVATPLEETTTGVFDTIGGIFNYFLPSTSTSATTLASSTSAQGTTEEATAKYSTETIVTETALLEEVEGKQIDSGLNRPTVAPSTQASSVTHPPPQPPAHRFAEPKSIDTQSIFLSHSDYESDEAGEKAKAEKHSPPKKFLEDKLGFVVKKREQLIKNWVQRKYANGKEKSNIGVRYEPLQTVATTSTAAADSSTPVDTTASPRFDDSQSDLDSENSDAISTTIHKSDAADTAIQGEVEEAANSEFHIPFAPTIIPKGKYKETKGKEKLLLKKYKKQSLLDKYSSARKTHLLGGKKQSGSPAISNAAFSSSVSAKRQRIPLGSNPNIYKKWAGGSLSQSDFERQILGVSTATEVSVQSRICVRGRCFNADDMSGILN